MASEERRSVSEAVLQEVAEEEGVPPGELNDTLFDVVDPDALDVIFRADCGFITFEYHGYLVTVDHSGFVTLEPADESSPRQRRPGSS